MIIITGTPGTGKTSVAKKLSKLLGRDVVHLNEYIKKEKLYDSYERTTKTYVVNPRRLRNLNFGDAIVEGHLSHFIKKNVEKVIVLRCSPPELERRLKRKKWRKRKICENVLAEMLDVISAEAEELHRGTIEIDTTNSTPQKTAEKIMRYIKKGKSDEISWLLKFQNFVPELEKCLKRFSSNKS